MNKSTEGDTLLPWPEQWPAPRPKLWIKLTAGYLGALTLLAGGLGSWALLSGQPGPAIFLLGGGAYLGLVTVLSVWLLRTRRRLSPRTVTLHTTGSAEDGVLIAYSGWLYRWLATMMLLTFAVLAGIVLSGLTGWVIPPFTSPPGVVSVVLLSATELYCLWILLEMASGQLAHGRVALSPQGIHHRSLTFEHGVPGYAVNAVSAEDLNGPVIVAKAFPSDHTRVRKTSWVGKQQEFQLLPYLAVRGRSLAVDPAVLYHALRYYHAHPEDRPELATDAGVR
ncbi:MAG: hypothetical protein ACRDTG_02685 [Pseudonocardiaceae bacterium]